MEERISLHKELFEQVSTYIQTRIYSFLVSFFLFFFFIVIWFLIKMLMYLLSNQNVDVFGLVRNQNGTSYTIIFPILAWIHYL